MNKQVGFAPRPGIRTCHNYWCNYKTREPLDACPKCGRPLLTGRVMSSLGWLLVVCGGLLGATGASLLLFLAPKLLGGVGIKLLVSGLFAALMLVGLAFMAAGFRQALTGRRSQMLTTVAVVIVALFFIIGAIVRVVLLNAG